MHPGEGVDQRLGPRVVALADDDAALDQVGDLDGRAHDGDDVLGGHTLLQQVLDDEAAEVSGRSGDGVAGHGQLL